MSTMQTRQKPTTWEDVLRMPDDGNRYEFIGGRLYVTAAPVTRHQRISKRLQAALLRLLEDAGHGEVFDAPFLVEFPGIGDRVQPDLIFVADERREIIGEKQVLGAPDLVVEILSPSTAHRDRGIKLDLYARCGVRQYWIVDPVEDVVDVWHFGDKPGHERFSGEFPVRLGAERVGRIDLDQIFSRHLDVWGTREGSDGETSSPEEDPHMSDDLPEREEGRDRREATDDHGDDGTPATGSAKRVTAARLRGAAALAGGTLKRGAAAAGRAAGAVGGGMAGSAKAVGGRMGDVSVRAGRLVSESLGQVPVRRLSEPLTAGAANFGNALLATDVAVTLDGWTRAVFASGRASPYDRAMDLTYNTLKQHGADHRIFDGGHDPVGAWKTIAEAFPDEGWLDRGEAYVSALWKDMVTPNGIPVVTWDKGAFDTVAGFLNETLGVSRNWSKDMVTFTATEFTGAALGALALVLSWNNAETRRFAEIVASLGLSAVVGANPLLVMVAIVGLAKCFHEARHEGGLKRVLSGGGRGTVGTAALLGASRLMPAPAWVTLVLGVVSYLVATRLYDKAEPKAEELGRIVRDWFGSREWTESCSELARNTYLRGKAVAGGVRESVLAGDLADTVSAWSLASAGAIEKGWSAGYGRTIGVACAAVPSWAPAGRVATSAG